MTNLHTEFEYRKPSANKLPQNTLTLQIVEFVMYTKMFNLKLNLKGSQKYIDSLLKEKIVYLEMIVSYQLQSYLVTKYVRMSLKLVY